MNLLIWLFAGLHVAHGQEVKIQDLQILEEDYIEYQEFRRAMATNDHLSSDDLNHPDLLIDGNHPDMLLDANHPDMLLDANHPDVVIDGSHPDLFISGPAFDQWRKDEFPTPQETQ